MRHQVYAFYRRKATASPIHSRNLTPFQSIKRVGNSPAKAPAKAHAPPRRARDMYPPDLQQLPQTRLPLPVQSDIAKSLSTTDLLLTLDLISFLACDVIVGSVRITSLKVFCLFWQ